MTRALIVKDALSVFQVVFIFALATGFFIFACQAVRNRTLNRSFINAYVVVTFFVPVSAFGAVTFFRIASLAAFIAGHAGFSSYLIISIRTKFACGPTLFGIISVIALRAALGSFFVRVCSGITLLAGSFSGRSYLG